MTNQSYETKIGHLIHENIKVEWMRYNMYKESDVYAFIPMLVFRICDEEENGKIECLKKCILDYKGINRWRLFINPLTKKKNYILSLEIVEKMYNEVAEGIFSNYEPMAILGEKEYKKVCITAVQEIPELEFYLEEYFAGK